MTTDGLRGLCAFIALAAAVTMMSVGPAAANDAYARKLDACRKAATADLAMTDFKCDWRAVTRGAPGAAFTGRYTFAERGYAGEMTVLEGGGPNALVAVSTVTNDRGAHTCTAGFEGQREDDVLVLRETSDDACVVRIQSTRRVNVVEVTATEACRNFCGMRGMFEGRWRLRK